LAALTIFVGPASAAIDPAGYRHVDAVVENPGAPGGTGGYIACPAGMRAISSGATSFGPSDRWTAGDTTFDGTGVFVTAAADKLQVSARCVDAAQVQASTLATTTIRDSRPVARYPHFGRALCPPNTVAYGGGGFFTRPGGTPFGGFSVYASMPQNNGTEWFFGAAEPLFPDKELWVSTHCLPRSQFGQILIVTETDTSPPGASYPTLSVAARCPAGSFAFAGGAWWHRASGATPEWLGYLTGSNMTADDRGWAARGWAFNLGEPVRLTARVECMTRVIDRPSQARSSARSDGHAAS
jgi:hypothetical protein